jgi:hypothetical protein
MGSPFLPGKRIEITAPELIEGAGVEIFVTLPENSSHPELETLRQFKDVIAFLDSLTPVQRTPEEWAQVERELQEERDSWER